MNIYDKYKKIANNLGTLRKAYFTTFNLDIDFIESYILPPLFKETPIKNDKNSKQKREELNKHLYRNRDTIKFFYDASMLTYNYKQTIVNIYPVVQGDGGVFHPKVIYLEGENATYLIVGSGNLTVNGWGRNIESFQIIQLKNKRNKQYANLKNLENQVDNFFIDVFKKAKLKPEYERYKKIDTLHDRTNFIYSHSNKSDSVLLKYLKLDKSLHIYSPYFSPLDELFGVEEFKGQFKGLETVNIVPDLIANQKIRLKQKTENSKIKFHLFNKKELIGEKNEDSFNHSKVWISQSRYAVGSYNCTEAALYGVNFEAALIQRYSQDELLYNNPIEKLEYLNENEDIGDEDESDEEKRCSYTFRLVADYENRTLKFEESIDNDVIKYIKVPSFAKKISYESFSNLSYSEISRVISALVHNKYYEVYDDKTSIFTGIIEERNASAENRFAVGITSLEELFLDTDKDNPTLSKKLMNKTLSSNSDEVLYKKKKNNLKHNYHAMYSYFQKLNNYFETIKDDTQKLKLFCDNSVGSLSKVKKLLEEQKNEESLFLYIMIEEFNVLASKVEKVNKEDLSMKNIQMKLSKKEQNFIKAIKWD